MLSDLEAAAVGEVLKHQPCTAHFIRTCFRDSLARHFSDSSGSVYPMMKRLEQRGVLESTRRKDGKRHVRHYRVTGPGRAALRKWLGPPISEDVTLTIDPLRTRLLYLQRLPKAKRALWISEVESAIRQKLKDVKCQHSNLNVNSADALYQQLAIENGISELNSRLSWLARVRRQLKNNDQI